MRVKTLRQIHVVRHGDVWQVKVDGNDEPIQLKDRQSQAIDWARKFAHKNNSELVVHDKDGLITEVDSTGLETKS